MNNILTLFRREYLAYFNSPIAAIVIPVFLLLFGVFFFFVSDFFGNNQTSLRAFFEFAPLMTAIFTPALTMRLIAEEKRSGTLELLVTLPLSETEIVFGKFLGAWFLMITGFILTFAYALTVSSLGDIDWGPVAGGYIGIAFLSGAYIAIGTWMSSLTNNQIIAFFVSLFINICFLLVDVAVMRYLPGKLIPVGEFFSFNAHFHQVARGVVDLRDISFYLSVIALSLFGSIHALRMRRLA